MLKRFRASACLLSLAAFLLWLLIPGAVLGSGVVDYVPPQQLTEEQAALIMLNAERAAEAMDGALVYPGQVFSFWDAAGPFDAAHGYVYGYGVLNGKVVPALAGGVCVTSTALYRAVLDAGLEVVERHPHGVPLAWANGDDAAVSFHVNPDGSLSRGWDFRFQNGLKKPVAVFAWREGSRVEVEIREVNPISLSVTPCCWYGMRHAGSFELRALSNL